MNTTANNAGEETATKPDECPAVTPDAKKAKKITWNFEEMCDKLQRFAIRTAAKSALVTLCIMLLGGLVFLIAMWLS